MATPTRDPIIIADTSALYSLMNRLDRNHRAARAAAEELAHRADNVLVPWDVFVETMNTVGKKNGHTQALAIADYLTKTPLFLVIDVSERARREALGRFGRQPESVSFADCLVMAVDDEYETKRIFGFDQAFDRNGYRILGKEGSLAA